MPHPTATEPIESSARDVAARGQRIVLLLARSGRRLGLHIGERLGNPELAGNVPALILCELSLRGPLRPRDLLEPVHLTSGTLTKQLDHLEQLGLIDRSFGTVRGDRRGSIVSLTPEGQRAAETINGAVEERIDELRALRDELCTLLDE